MPFRVEAGDRLVFITLASAAVRIRGRFRVRYDQKKGPENVDFVTTADVAATRTVQYWVSDWIATADGYVESGIIVPFNASVDMKRGMLYVACYLFSGLSAVAGGTTTDPGGTGRDLIAKGYVYDLGDLSVGTFVEPGPGGGEGFLSWVSLAADIAPVDVTRSLAATNAFRRIHGFAWYYNASGTAATRTLNASLRRPGLTVPTGFTLDAVAWASGTITLTLDQEGLMYIKGQSLALNVLNDNGALTVANHTTAPVPFPYDATEDDLADLFFDVGAAETDDRHSIFLLQEEWLKI